MSSWQFQVDSLVKILLNCPKQDFIPNQDKFDGESIVQLLKNRTLLEALENKLNHYENLTIQICSKNYLKAEELRLKGNKLYATGNNDNALASYNNSIRHYPGRSDEDSSQNSKEGLALAYANRSAVFYNKNYFDECLVDIAMALSLSYPKHLYHKLLSRKARCLLIFSRLDDAEKTLKEAMLACELYCKMENKLLIAAAIDKLQEQVSTAKTKSILLKRSSDTHTTRERKIEYNKSKIAGASLGLELHYNELKGRHLIANRSFIHGDIIISERPYAAILLPKWYSSNCYHCLAKTDAIFPCPNCNLISYCSVACQEESWQNYHNIECKHLLLFKEMGVTNLALRILLQTSVTDLHDFHFQHIFSSNSSKIQAEYHKGYKGMCNLVSHAKETSTEKTLQYGISALMLFLVLKRANFFKRPSIQGLRMKNSHQYCKCQADFKQSHAVEDKGYHVSDVELLISSLLLRHLHQIVCNSVAVTALCETQSANPTAVTEYNQNRIATAIYLTASLMNHSCDPTCILTFHGGLLTVKMIKNVGPGEEISICYGPHFKKMKYEDRVHSLQDQYYFTCFCQPCKNRLGTDSSLQDCKCMNCEAAIPSFNIDQCLSCSKAINSEYYNHLYECSMAHLKESSSPENADKPTIVLKHLKKCLELQDKIFHEGSQRLGTLYNSIALCLAKQEQYVSSIFYFEKSVEITQCYYGEKSIEVGYALLTLSDLTIKVIQSDIEVSNKAGGRPDFKQIGKCSVMVKKAIQILRELSNPHSDELSDLQEKDMYLSSLLSQA